MRIIPKILVFAGSLRSGAFSISTADVAMKELALQGAEVTRISLADYPLADHGSGSREGKRRSGKRAEPGAPDRRA